jgi:hypothetical protein
MARNAVRCSLTTSTLQNTKNENTPVLFDVLGGQDPPPQPPRGPREKVFLGGQDVTNPLSEPQTTFWGFKTNPSSTPSDTPVDSLDPSPPQPTICDPSPPQEQSPKFHSYDGSKQIATCLNRISSLAECRLWICKRKMRS